MTKQLKPQFAADNYPIYGWDGGNERGKLSTILAKALREEDPDESNGAFSRNSIQLNAVAEISKREYESAARRHRGHSPDYSFMHLRDGKKDVFLVVGDAALYFISDLAAERRMNKAKYSRHYYGAQFVRGLTSIHKRNIPDNLHVIAGHPPLNSEKAPEIIDALKGRWKVDFMGEEVEFFVHTVKAVDEIMGAAMNVKLKANGYANGRAATVNRGKTIAFDLGGGTLDVMLIDEKGLPVPGSLRSAEVGIFKAMLEFKLAFDEDQEMQKQFGESTSGIDLAQVYEIFRDSQHYLRGGGLEKGYIDCRELYESVMLGELNRLYGITKGLLGNIATAGDQAMILGGAGDLLFEQLSEVIFPNYASNGRLLLGAPRGYGILGASIGMAKFGEMLRRLEEKYLRETR